MKTEPIKLSPAFKDYLWGGTRLKTEFGMKSNLDKVAEAWELSCHPDGPSIVASGECAGMTLAEYLAKAGKAALGTHCAELDSFPVLIKLIDAANKLSVQVHPDDEYAKRVEHENGKPEMWYVVDCAEGATLIYGFNREISKEEFRRRIEDNTLTDVVNTVPVHRGDVFFIEAGTLHAIGSGILIAEIQQNSNSTYRVSDYGRLGADGKPRPLHIDKALDVTKLTPSGSPDRREAPVEREGCITTVLARCSRFTVTAIDLRSKASFCADETSFHALLCTEGEAALCCGEKRLTLGRGECIFIPACCGEYSLDGAGRILCTSV